MDVMTVMEISGPRNKPIKNVRTRHAIPKRKRNTSTKYQRINRRRSTVVSKETQGATVGRRIRTKGNECPRNFRKNRYGRKL